MNTITRPRTYIPALRMLALAASTAVVALIPSMLIPSTLRAQSVPVPFAATYAGAGTVCAGSLPVFAVTGTGAKYGDGCPATQATLNVPVAVATDSLGNVFIADQTDMLVRVVYNGGVALAAAIATSNVQNPGLVPQQGYIYTIAGGITATPTEGTKYCNQAGSGVIGTGSELDNCPGSESEEGPRGLAVDADGNLFIASVSPNSQIRVLYISGTAAAKLITLQNPTVTSPIPGYVYNIGGANSSAYTGDGASAIKASLNTPRGIFVDSNENVYFADQLNNAIRRIDSVTGFISTVAGHNAGSVSSCSAVTSAGDSGSATLASLACPYGLTIDASGNIFIAEAGEGSTTVPGRVRVVLEGGALPGIISPMNGDIYTYAGGGTGTTQALQTTFQEVFGVALDTAGYLYVTDYRTGSTGSNHIWRVDPTNGNIAAIAGNGASALTTGNHCNGLTTGPTATDTRGDGCPASQAYLNIPQEAVGFDAHGNFYVADRGNNAVRSFTYDSSFPTTAVGANVTQPLAFLYAAGTLPVTETFTTQGSAAADYSDAGGDTCALNATLTTTTTCVDYVKFAPTASGQRPGSITVSSASATIATQALSGVGMAPVLTIAPPSSIALGSAIQPLSVSTDELGNVNISDGKGNQVLRTTIAGGTPTTLITGLGSPRESTVDSYGDVFVADSTNNDVVEHTAAGATATFGVGLASPQGIAADIFGNVYVADTGNNRLLYLSPITGIQHTVPVSGVTLSAPTYLAMDPAGDLYIIDTGNTRLVEVPLGGLPQLLTLPSGAQPVAVAFDPGGDLYIADKASGDILFVAAGSSTATPLVTGLTTPAGVAVGPTGNVFVADSSATAAEGYNFALNASTFTTTNIGLTSLPITLTVASVGNLSATLATPAYVESGTNASAFLATTPSSCTSAEVLATGASCTESFQFSPTTPGSESAKVVFSDTTGQSVTANFSAVATNLILTTTKITLVNTGAVNYGQTATYSVTLTPASNGSAAPTGTISFVVDGKTNQTQPVSANPYTFSVQLGVGIHTIAAVYSGDAIYAGSNASTSINIGKAMTTTTASYSQTASGTVLGAVVTPASTGAATFTGNVLFYIDGAVVATLPVGNGTVSTTVLIADGSHTYYAMYVGDANYAASSSTPQTLVLSRTPTTTTLTIMPVSSNGTSGLLLSAKVSTTGTGTPSGTVTFSNGSTTLGSVNLSTAVNGVVTFTTSTTTYASYVFTAAYSGDGLFQPSSATATEGPDFLVVAPATGISVSDGGQAILAVTVAPINGYTGTLTAACTNLPVDSVCRFQPAPLTLTATASSTLSVQVFAGVNPNVASTSHGSFSTSSGTLLALLLLVPAAFGLRRRKQLARLLSVMLLAVIAAASLGCGNKTPAAPTKPYDTPAGVSAVTVTVTDTNGVARSAIFNLTVTGQ